MHISSPDIIRLAIDNEASSACSGYTSDVFGSSFISIYIGIIYTVGDGHAGREEIPLRRAAYQSSERCWARGPRDATTTSTSSRSPSGYGSFKGSSSGY
jgi:hypothetical protein